MVTASSRHSLAASSRFCDREFFITDPLRDGADYVNDICDIVDRFNIDVVFPMTEQSIYRLNSGRDSLPEKTLLACPQHEVMQAVSDKSALFKLAENLQVVIPQTFYLMRVDDFSRVVKQIDNYPVVVKPALSRTPVKNGFLSGGVRYASTVQELEHLYCTDPVFQFPSLIQEKIVGPGTGLFTLYDKDRHLALFSHKRLREKPPSGGVSVVSESVPLDEEMVDFADRLLSAVGFTGVAMVEFKRDQRDGRAKLMEINGRFWGSLQLAVACGVDFPGLFLDYLQANAPVKPVKDYKTGHKLKWFFGTLDHLLIRLKYLDETLNLSPNAPSRFQAILEFLNIREQNTTFDVFDNKDLGPFWFETKSYFKKLFNHRG